MLLLLEAFGIYFCGGNLRGTCVSVANTRSRRSSSNSSAMCTAKDMRALRMPLFSASAQGLQRSIT